MAQDKFQDQLKTQANQYLKDGKSTAEVQQWIDRQKKLYAESNAGKTQEPELKDATAVQSDGASISDDTSLDLFYPELEKNKDSIQNRFDRGLFSKGNKEAYDKYKETGDIDPKLLGYIPQDKEEYEANALAEEERIAAHNLKADEARSNLTDTIGGRLLVNPVVEFGAKAIDTVFGLDKNPGDVGAYDLTVETAAAFTQGSVDLLAGLGNFLVATGFSTDIAVRQLFDKDLAKKLEEDPELRYKLYKELEFSSDTGARDLITQFDKTATDAALEGNWGEFGHNLVVQTSQAAPSLVATATGIGGMAVLGLSAAGSSFGETLEQAEGSSLGSIYLTSLMKGGYEFASEYATRGLLKKAGLLFKQGGQPAINAYSKSILKETFKGFNIEGGSEAAASLAGHITDYVVHGIEPPKNLWKQLADEWLVGGLLGGGTSIIGSNNQLPPEVINARLENQAKINADKADADALNDLINTAANAKTQEETDLLNKDIAEINNRIAQRAKDHSAVVEDFTVNEAQSLLDYKGRAEKYDNLVKTNENLTDEQRTVFELKAQESRNKADAIYDKIAKFPQAVQEAAAQKAEIKTKREEIKTKEEAIAKAENPNPVTTQKLNQQKTELDAKEKAVNDSLTQFRPAVSTEGLSSEIDKLSERNEATHKDNLKVLENQNATKEEIAQEVANYNLQKDNLAAAKEGVEDVLVQKGKARADAISTLEETITPKAPSGSNIANAKSIIKGTEKITNAAAELADDATSRTKANKLAKALQNTSEGVGAYLGTVLSPYGAKIAIDNVVTSIEGNDKLTDDVKKALIADLHKETPKQVPLKSTPGEASYLDDSDIQAIDEAQYEQDIRDALDGGFAEATKDSTERKEIDVTEAENADEVDRDKAISTYQGFIDRTIDVIFNGAWKYTRTGVVSNVKAMPAKRIHEIIAESLVGSKTENFKFDNTPASGTLTRIGRKAYEYLKSKNLDVAHFEKLPPRLERGMRAAVDKDGNPKFTEEDILKRAINYRSLEAGGDILSLVGGVNGFFEYQRGFPQIERKSDGTKVNKRPDRLKFQINDKDALDEVYLEDGTKFVDKINELRRNKTILLPKSWATKDGGIGLTIQDKLAFKEAIGYDFIHELLDGDTILSKIQDYKKSEPTTTRLAAPVNKETDSESRRNTDKALFEYYVRGAAIESQKVSDEDAVGRVPLREAPKAWTSFWHGNGLGAISNAGPKTVKAFKNAFKAMQTLTNAGNVKYSINERAYKMFTVLQEHLYQYTNDTADIQNDKINEFHTIRDIAKATLGGDFHAMHRFDFRGRLYNAVKFLNFQNNKVAKALHRFGGKPKPIGKEGFAALIKQIGDYYGGDITLPSGEVINSKTMTNKDRFRVGMLLVNKMANVAADPLSTESIEFLKKSKDTEDIISLSTEMLELVEHVKAGNSVESFPSNYIVWNDATVSGAQNLAMLTQDSVTLALVNGLDTYQKRDLYLKVGNRVFDSIEDAFNALPKDKQNLSLDDEADFLSINKQLEEILNEKNSPGVYKDEDISALEDKYKQIVESDRFNELAIKYWNNPERRNEVRGLAKGPVMTGFYSAGPWVMAEDMVTDFQDNGTFKDLNQGLAFWLTKQMKDATTKIAPGPKLAQSTFNRLGGIAAKLQTPLELQGFINDFPFLQEYLYYKDLVDENGKILDAPIKVPNPDGTSLRFDGNEFQVKARIGEAIMSLMKTQTSSAPNITHFLDGQVIASQFTNEVSNLRSTATIHDNFGTHPSDADAQVQSVLDSMADMYSSPLMENIIRQALSFDPTLAEEEVLRYRQKRAALKDETGRAVDIADTNAIRKNKYAISSAGGTTRVESWGNPNETAMEQRIRDIKDTFKNVDSENSLTRDVVVGKTIPSTEVAEANIKNIEKVVKENEEALKEGRWVLLSLSEKTNPKEGSLLESLNKEGYETKTIPSDPNKVAVRASEKIMTKGAALAKIKTLKSLLNGSYTYSSSGKIKASKITQEVRDILDATRLDFASRGHLYTESQIDELILKLDRLILNGKQSQRDKRKAREEESLEIENGAAEFLKDISGIDPKATNATQLAHAKNKSRGVKEFFSKAKYLVSTGNLSFYETIYDLLPTGKGRAEAKKFQKEHLTDVLEKGKYNQSEMKREIEATYGALKRKHKVGKLLDKPSGISVSGYELSNSQVVKIYNYIKDPSLYKKLEKGGFNLDKLNEILDYLDTNKALKDFSRDVPTIFSGSKAFINQKLNDHGYKGVKEQTIVTPTDAAALELLTRIYDGNIPQTAPYTPFTGTSTDSKADVAALLDFQKGNFYSVLSGKLIDRQRGGALDIYGKTLEGDIVDYIKGPVRTANYLDFARNTSAVFSEKNRKAMNAAFGKEWGKSLNANLEGILTGRTRTNDLSKPEQAVLNWFNQSIGGVMLLNMRSGALQLLSMPNYIVENPAQYSKGIAAGPAKLKEAAQLIIQSGWFKERGGGGTDLAFEDIFQDESIWIGGRALNKVLQKGYVVTKAFDKTAILLAGTPLLAGKLAEGMSVEQAMTEFITLSDKTQQTVSPERLGAETRGTVGRLIHAFSSVNQLYNKEMHRNVRDLFAKGTPNGDRKKYLAKTVYYGVLQNAAFNVLQQWLFSALDLDDEDEFNNQALNAGNSGLDTILRGVGIWGAVLSTVKNVGLVYFKDKDRHDVAERMLLKAASLWPGLSAKARQLKTAFGAYIYPLSNGPADVPEGVIRGASGITLVTGAPLDRLIKKYSALNDMFADDLSAGLKLLRFWGWDRYSIGASTTKGKSTPKEEDPTYKGLDSSVLEKLTK